MIVFQDPDTPLLVLWRRVDAVSAARNRAGAEPLEKGVNLCFRFSISSTSGSSESCVVFEFAATQVPQPSCEITRKKRAVASRFPWLHSWSVADQRGVSCRTLLVLWRWRCLGRMLPKLCKPLPTDKAADS